jgi:hypothetical protein
VEAACGKNGAQNRREEIIGRLAILVEFSTFPPLIY